MYSSATGVLAVLGQSRSRTAWAENASRSTLEEPMNDDDPFLTSLLDEDEGSTLDFKREQYNKQPSQCSP